MIIAAIALFSLAAILGLLLFGFVIKGKHTPKALVLTHGPLAIAGIILLVIYCTQNDPDPIDSLILFLIAASGGLILVARDLMGKTIPKWLAAIHGLLAVAGFSLLLMFQFS
ncbi:MAG TPA: hypothetical protein VGC65_03885 [Bacteroidia bacterium]|jgi:peptidoglycan/LPS O-acetylase OafA/YrhL